MSVTSFIIVGMSLAGLIYFFLIYNGLVAIKNNVYKNLANIDVLLKQRHTELPQLVAVCKGYMKHERETLESLVKARGSVISAVDDQDIKALGRAEGTLRHKLGRLFAVVEQYPDLKADRQFLKLQRRIGELEDAIADRREFFNESVRINNVRIEQIPDMFLARMFGFKPFDYLDFPADEMANVNVNELMREA